jgi:hypothetical protein
MVDELSSLIAPELRSVKCPSPHRHRYRPGADDARQSSSYFHFGNSCLPRRQESMTRNEAIAIDAEAAPGLTTPLGAILHLILRRAGIASRIQVAKIASLSYLIANRRSPTSPLPRIQTPGPCCRRRLGTRRAMATRLNNETALFRLIPPHSSWPDTPHPFLPSILPRWQRAMRKGRSAT